MLTSLDLEQTTHKFQETAFSGIGGARPDKAGDLACDIDLQLVSDIAGFEALESEWNKLFDRAGKSHQLFQSYNWNWHWCQNYLIPKTKRTSLELSIVVGKKDGRVVMIWPLISDSSIGVKFVCWMGMPVSQYSDVLIEDDPRKLEWLNEGWRYIRTQMGVDIICLQKVRADAELSNLTRCLNLQPVLQTEAPYADLSKAGSHEVYEERFSARLRKNRRRQLRRLSEQGDVSIEFLTKGKAACEAVQQAIEMKCRWLQKQGLVSKAFADDRIEKFFANILTSSNRPTGCQVSVMKVGNEIAAIVIGIVCKGRHVTHISAYNIDPQFIRSGAGALLIDATVRNCLDMDLNNFDMMAPGDPYKYEWSDASVKVSDYAVPLTPRGQAYAAFGSCAYCAKAAFETAPQRLRRALLALAGHRRELVSSKSARGH